MKVDVRSLGSHLASLVWVALRSFGGTIFVFSLIGVVLAGLSYYFLRQEHWLVGVLAVVVVLIESVTTGILLGAKRATAMAVAYGLGSLRLGRWFVGLVFERLLGIAKGEDRGGELGGRIARSLEQLPLSQADELLSRAVREIMGDAEQAGWLRRKIHGRLLAVIRKYTLARFREEGATHGGINLLKMKEELEQTVDEALIHKVRGGLRLWTALVMVGLPIAVAVQTWILLTWLRSHG